MKSKIVITLLAGGMFAVGALISGCASDAHQTTTTASDSGKSGARLWTQNCARCHNSRPSTDYSNEKWEVAMLHMRVRANLTGEEQKKILEFLQSGE